MSLFLKSGSLILRFRTKEGKCEYECGSDGRGKARRFHNVREVHGSHILENSAAFRRTYPSALRLYRSACADHRARASAIETGLSRLNTTVFQNCRAHEDG